MAGSAEGEGSLRGLAAAEYRPSEVSSAVEAKSSKGACCPLEVVIRRSELFSSGPLPMTVMPDLPLLFRMTPTIQELPIYFRAAVCILYSDRVWRRSW